MELILAIMWENNLQMLRGSSLFSPAADSNICHLIMYKDKVISCLQIQSELMDGAN